MRSYLQREGLPGQSGIDERLTRCCSRTGWNQNGAANRDNTRLRTARGQLRKGNVDRSNCSDVAICGISNGIEGADPVLIAAAVGHRTVLVGRRIDARFGNLREVSDS